MTKLAKKTREPEWHYTIHLYYDHDSRNDERDTCARAQFVMHREGQTFETGPMDVITADCRIAEMAQVLESYLAKGEIDGHDMGTLEQATEPLRPKPKLTEHERAYLARMAGVGQ